MTKFYSYEAVKSEIDKIEHLIHVVSTTPGNVIGYLDARALTTILAERKEDLEKELERLRFMK